MSKQKVEARLERIRASEREYTIGTALALGSTALLGIASVNNWNHSRAFEAILAVAQGGTAVWYGMKARSKANTAASIEAVLAQDDLYTMPAAIEEESEVQVSPTVLFDQEQPDPTS